MTDLPKTWSVCIRPKKSREWPKSTNGDLGLSFFMTKGLLRFFFVEYFIEYLKDFLVRGWKNLFKIKYI